jgi:hypothetical protein
MFRGFDDDFVSADRTHAIVDAVRNAAGFAFDHIERVEMGDDADLGRSARG